MPTDQLAWLREQSTPAKPDHHPMMAVRFDILAALIDVAKEAEGHRHDYGAGALDNALDTLDAAIRKEMLSAGNGQDREKDK